MNSLYSYVLRIDDGAAPNPFWGLCTLTICKPAIRRNAKIGDWIVGTGSKNVKLKDNTICDFTGMVVYAMKVSEIMPLAEYDIFCNNELINKIPNWRTTDWKQRVGDCIYNFLKGTPPAIRKSVHDERNRLRDLSGQNSLISNHFYYFGLEAMPLPVELQTIIKKNQGHKKIDNSGIIEAFENWISQFEKNRIYGDPQMRWLVDREISDEEFSNCAKQHLEDEDDEKEERLC